jgi:hypothetical protein
MGIWQRVVMDSLRFHLGLPCSTFLRPAGGPPLKRPYGLMAVSAMIFYPLGRPMPYTYDVKWFEIDGAEKEREM